VKKVREGRKKIERRQRERAKKENIYLPKDC
jgi:hypothetical protein